jgi:hypothetical protein
VGWKKIEKRGDKGAIYAGNRRRKETRKKHAMNRHTNLERKIEIERKKTERVYITLAVLRVRGTDF